MRISETIESFIKKMLTQADGGTIDLQRNELANQLGCVPSQINYVISTRFTNEHGYIVESKRGGGGYIRITRIQLDRESYLMHIINCIGNSLTAGEAAVFINNCRDSGFVSKRELNLLLSAAGDNSLALQQPERDIIRARILKNMLLTLV